MIDSQLNKVRDEIDDNRIYVDANRFSSWINDEVLVELNRALTTSSVNTKTFSTIDEAVVNSVIERCFSAFCTHSTFGIASYLGRRIRHGTFKGQLYTTLINTFEKLPKFKALTGDEEFVKAWTKFKAEYEAEVEVIVSRRLHIESSEKTQGFLRPHLVDLSKQEIQQAAAKKHYPSLRKNKKYRFTRYSHN